MHLRPLCVALIVWIGIIFLFRDDWQENPEERKGDHLSMVCQVEEILGTEKSLSLIVRNVYVGDTKICRRMKLYQGKNQSLFSNIHIGQILQVKGTVYSFDLPGNPGQFNEYEYNLRQLIQYRSFVDHITILDRSYHRLQERIRQLRLQLYRGLQVCCSKRDAGILAAMILGEKGAADEDIKRLYQENGIAHILAISGLHISLIGAGLFFLLRKYIMPMRMAVFAASGILILYGILTGFPVSTSRAVSMMICMFAARLFNRKYDAYCALALSAWFQLLRYPLSLFQTGFLLSYGTVLGILLFVKQFQKAESGNQVLAPVMGALGISFVTLPVLLYFYYEIPLYSLIANVVLLPFLGILLGTGLCGAFLSLCSVYVARFCMGMAHYILGFYEIVCRFLEILPNHQIILGCPYSWQIVAYFSLLFLWIVFQKKYPQYKFWILLVLAVGILDLTPRREADGLRITNLDVGQGDCTCIRIKDKTILIDGGSSDVTEVGKYRIVKFLKYYGIRRIDRIFITHSDSDHTNGLLEIIQDPSHMGFSIGKIVLPDIKKQDKNYFKLKKLCVASGLPVDFMKKGDYVSIDHVKMRCLHPYPSYDWESENDYSLVLEVQYGNFKGLFTGDLEEQGEREICSQLHTVQYLKVAHHGSKGSSSEEFLTKTNPRICVYSAGENNRYGHPSKETRQRVKKIKAKEFCTIQKGAVTIITDGNVWSVESLKP